MNIADLKGKKITVMGLGLHGGGIGTVRFLSDIGARVTVTDIKSKEELASSLEKLKDLKNITYVFNQHRPEDFSASDMVIKNPAAPWTNKYIKLAIDSKVPVEMDASLFFKLCKNPIVGITGTKGKTTTSSLIYEILKLAGKSPMKVGIGQTSVLDKLKELKKESTVVFELSSWRLSALGRYKLSPRVAIITNIYPDHLNYYKSMDDYVRDKKYIFQNQKHEDSCVISADNEIVNKFDREIKSQLIKFSKNKISEGKSVYISEGAIYFNDGIDEKKVVDTAQIKLRGEHNLENVMAAVGACFSFGVDISIIRKAILEFGGVSHRLELVRELNGVKYVNDSAATTPEAAMAGLKSFSEPIILICGGSDKKLDMGEFGKKIIERVHPPANSSELADSEDVLLDDSKSEKVNFAKRIGGGAKGVIFLKGEATEKIIAAMKDADANLAKEGFRIVDSMEKAVELAQKEAQGGEIVLLSPGAASFGLFLNEFDRGDKFRGAVKNLK